MTAAHPTVLLTGATGFVGNAVRPALVAKGWRVRCLTRDVARARRRLPALEWVEDQLIIGSRSGAALSDEVPLDRLTVLAGLTAAERELVERTLERRVYQRGDIVIKEGDTDRSLFMISKGTASVKVSLAGQARERRLASFSPGAVFGEVALLDEEPRSATVTADEELVCYVLDDARFRTLTRAHPSIAITLQPRRSSSAVSRPVPAPRSTASPGRSNRASASSSVSRGSNPARSK